MSETAIRVESLSKLYKLGAPERYRTLRDTITSALRSPFSRLFSSARDTANETGAQIWALNDVSFEVKRGEVVGIIGKNGAGKSTLLRILSRVTEPTKGSAEIHGRIGSLLEVGTGFHPELTGRENIYLNGAILGMKKAEIKRKFDEIVAFAGTEKFVDTPVKQYSSGMYMRLAFGVAAHLETEILLVDEVLAVGDAEFQRKCLAKMQHIALGGRTILFVSHNMAAIRLICNRGICFESGRLVDDDKVDWAADAYLTRLHRPANSTCIIETESFLLGDVEVKSSRGSAIKPFESVELSVTITPKVDILEPGLYAGILAADGTRIAGLDLRDFETIDPMAKGESARLGFVIEELPLLPGSYRLELHVKDMATHRIELVPELFSFEVVELPVYGGRKIDGWHGTIGLKARVRDSRLVPMPKG